ncbi:MAG: DNA polymerase III subunit alpha [Candidatus Fimenecus sp.]
MGFTHLHLHTQYSLLDGCCRFGDLFEAVKKSGQSAVAITDHGNMFGAVDFYDTAKKNGIKAIIGCECYVAVRSRFLKEHGIDSERYHLILLCENNIGYQNLIKIVSESWTTGFYTKPRIDRELLEKYHEGIICLTGCLAGEVPKLLLAGEYEKAKETAFWYEKTFGKDNYFLEIQNHGIEEEIRLIPEMNRLSQDTGIPLVVTNDVHYVEKNDSEVQKVLISIGTGRTVNDSSGIEFTSNDFYLKTEEEMKRLFLSYPEAIENTEKIANRCNVSFEYGNTKLPFFKIEGNPNHFKYFRDKCYEGLKRHYGENPDNIYIERLEYELSVIKEMGYIDYFLIVADYIAYAKKNRIPVGPGRGSGAGSIAAYCMGITGVDPIRYGLIFERFLNPERVSMPDLDIDFDYVRRQEVIDYVVRRYGKDYVAQIITFGTMAARAAVKDVGRAMGYSYSFVDSISKKIPRELNITIKDALLKTPELRELVKSDERAKKIISVAERVEGMPRHTSTHAAGVVITDKPVYNYVPLAVNDGNPVTQFTMTIDEKLGLLKMDFLGLRTLTVISDAEKEIQRKNPNFNIEKIPFNDKLTFEMLSRGETDGVFQCESAGITRVITRLKPQNIEDIIAVISLYRPGPMDEIDSYIKNRHNPENITYKTEKLKDILSVTYGCLVYQEQVMEVFRKLAGYSLGRADIVRRAMSKKKHDVMEENREYFVNGLKNKNGKYEILGCVNNGISKDIANSIFDDMSSFASYAFNKSHSAAYAIITYRTAYLKCNYPSEFMAALLSSVMDNLDKIAEYTDELSKMKIKLLPPDINRSFLSFSVDKGSVRFGLSALKTLGAGFVNSFIAEREQNGDFKDIYDFCNRCYNGEFNKRAVESLIKVGAFDSLGLNRRECLVNLSKILEILDGEKRRNIEGQLGLFEISEGNSPQLFEPERMAEFNEADILFMEKDISGLYISGHPLKAYRERFKKLGCKPVYLAAKAGTADSPIKDNEIISVLAIISNVRRRTTKKNENMAFLEIEDERSSLKVLVFPKKLLEYYKYLEIGNIVVIKGRISTDFENGAELLLESITSVEEYEREFKINPQRKKKKGVFVKFKTENEDISMLNNIIEKFNSENGLPVYIYFENTKQYKTLGKYVKSCSELKTELLMCFSDNAVVVE